ncbi:MAG: DUF2608 domain-containing protein [Holosporaceae bacterium]|nr:DUF2608 domain-containing protein [Holosporaceae bacterium]
MNKIVTFLFSLITFYSDAKIITTDKIEEVEAELAKANNEMLIVFDCNGVLLEPVDAALLRANKEESKKILAELIKNNPENQIILESGIIARDMKTQLVHVKWPALITAIQSRGIKTMLLTSGVAGEQGVIKKIENVKRDRLLSVGIDFKKSWKGVRRLEFHDIPSKRHRLYNTNVCVFVDGMLLANGVDKGEVLKSFLSKIPQYKFKRIIFIDDKLKNLESIEKICTEMGAQFVGIEYAYSKIKKYPSLNPKRVRKQYKILMAEKRWPSDEEMENSEKNPHDRMIEIIDSAVVRSCAGHQPTEEQVFALVRKSISENEIADDVLLEYISDFFEVRHKIYNMVGFVCQLEFARRAYAEKIDVNVVLECVNNNLFGLDSAVRISENIIKNAESQIKEEILGAGSGSLWKDQAKYDFVRGKLFKEKNSDASYKQLSPKKYANYKRIIEKVYDFGCDSHALNCKYYIARNFIRRGIDKKLICKIFSFNDNEFENFVKPV